MQGSNYQGCEGEGWVQEGFWSSGYVLYNFVLTHMYMFHKLLFITLYFAIKRKKVNKNLQVMTGSKGCWQLKYDTTNDVVKYGQRCGSQQQKGK